MLILGNAGVARCFVRIIDRGDGLIVLLIDDLMLEAE